jgi:release factor glutamine methyltransferase
VSAARVLLAEAAARLTAAGVGTPRVDAELLLAWALGTTRTALLTTDGVPADALSRFHGALERRAAREPLQHIVGSAPFRTVELAVGPGVFVPRPETELLVDAVLPRLPAGAVVVDLCAGSGALALAIAVEAPASRVIAVERSSDALPWLRRNVEAAGVEVVVGDVTDAALLAAARGTVDAVVSNPPYVPDATAVEPEVRADPREAVFAGAQGMAVIPHVVARAADLLGRGGILAVEHDDTHGTVVPDLLRGDRRWHDVADHPDLTGRPRYVTARRA